MSVLTTFKGTLAVGRFFCRCDLPWMHVIQDKRHVCEHFVKRLQDSQVSLPSCATTPPLHPATNVALF